MSPLTKGILLAVVSGVAALYFGVVLWRAASLAGVLMRTGYEEKGWTAPRLAARIRFVGIAGCVLSVVALVVSLVRAF